MSPARFDLTIVPAHDGLSGPGVLSLPAALGRSAPPADNRDARLDALPRPLLGILLGGPSRAAKVTRADFEQVSGLIGRAAAAGYGIAVLGSRRTPDWARGIISAHASEAAFIWDGREPNPYQALLAAADVFVVTGDSVNMVSEAAATGKPVYAAPVSHLAEKLLRFHGAMEAAGHVRPAASFDPTADLQAADAWRPVRLDTLSQAVSAVLPLL